MQTARGLPFIILLVAFSLGVFAHSSVLPLFEGSDENLHYAYVKHIRAAARIQPARGRLANGSPIRGR